MAPCTHPGTSGEVDEARGGLILAAGRVRSKKKKRKTSTRKKSPHPNTPQNPQQPGDRDHIETAYGETRPTR